MLFRCLESDILKFITIETIFIHKNLKTKLHGHLIYREKDIHIFKIILNVLNI